MTSKAIIGGTVAAVVLGIAALVGVFTGLDRVAQAQALKSDDLTGLRTEALGMFPRGSRLVEAEARLSALGFSCEAIPHPLPDISSPSLRCASNGRGYPDYPAVNVILLSRNGLVSDVDIWNIIARADGVADDFDFTAIGASDALSSRLRRPDADEATGTVASTPDVPRS